MRYVTPNHYWASDESIKVSDVHVVGGGVTKEDVFRLYLKPVEDARSADSLFVSLKQAEADLLKLGLFRQVRLIVDRGARANEAVVTVLAEERPRKEYSVGLAGGGSDDVVITGGVDVRNVLGRGETLHVAGASGLPYTTTHTTGTVVLTKPLLWAEGVRQVWEVGGHAHYVDRCVESLHSERVLSVFGAFHYGDVLCKVSTGASRLLPFHKRSRFSEQLQGTFANMEQSGWTPKTSAAVEWSRDERDNPLAAMKGSYHKGSIELATSPQELKLLFLKTELSAHHSVPVPAIGGSLLLRTKIGHIFGLGSRLPQPNHRHPTVTSVDAFHLGGPDVMPGFQPRGIGRSRSLESLGSCTYWLASLHYLASLPSVPEFLKGHVHGSVCGQSNLIGGSAEQQGFLSAFKAETMRASVGIGLIAVVPGMGRVTLTWSKVLKKAVTDNSTNMIQLGFSSNFD